MNRLLTAALVLIGAGALAAQPADPLASLKVQPPSGAYTGPVTVSVQAPEGAAVRYRFLESPGSASFPWSGNLTLETLPGETRVSVLRVSVQLATGEAVTRDYRYVVSRPAVSWPSVQPVPGVFTAAVAPKLTLPEGWSASEGSRPWTPGTVFDAPAGGLRTTVLTVRGPGDRGFTWTYTVDRRDQESPFLEILSPADGAWVNAQTLAAVFRGVDRVRWSWGDRYDPAHDQVYSGPAMLDRTGPQSLTMAARSRSDGRWLTQTVRFTAGTLRGPTAAWPGAGLQLSGVRLPAVPGWDLSWDNGASWTDAAAAREETPSLVSRKILTVETRGTEGLGRYLYWMDARPPQTPELTFTGGWNPELVFSGSGEAVHRAVWTFSDGRSAEDPVEVWGPRGSWKVPDDVVAVRVTARGANGLQAPAAAVSFPATGWSRPGWEAWDAAGVQAPGPRLPLGGRVPPRPGFRPVFETAGGPEVPEPTAWSPVLEGPILPMVPPGADRTLYVRFAWRDEAGLVGPAGPVQTLRLDRVPPQAPEVTATAAGLVVKAAEGEEEGTELWWAVTPARAATPEGLTFQPYRGPLDPAALASGSPRVWLHVQSRDPAGNIGAARLNLAVQAASASAGSSVVQSDSDPAVGDIAVDDGGVYPWRQFRLRPADGAQGLWVGIAEGTAVPTGWAARLEPWTGVISRSVAPGERRTFLIYWNLRAGSGWAWADPRILRLTLDQGPPAEPVVADPWPAAARSEPWTLRAAPGRPGDRLRFSFSLDGSEPSDPVASGQPWPGSQTWEAPAGGRTVVRVRLAAVSVGGLAFEAPKTSPVILDRTAAAAVLPPLEPFTWSSSPVVVPLPPGAPAVRGVVTSDGSVPSLPGGQDPLVPRTGLVLPGTEGRSVLYRFRWRAFSDSGLPGPASEAYSVLVDRSASTAPGVDTPAAAGTPPRLSGLPEGGVSAAPVVLRADGGPVLRYELREGVGSPRPVTAESKLWPGELALSGAPGTDRSYALAVRGFSPEGVPVTEEVRAGVRIDRQPPGAPPIRLEADSRRPEAVLRSGPANPGEQLWYSWSWESFPRGGGESAWASAEAGLPLFTAPGGTLTRLKVRAYLRDEAGNAGPVAEQTLLVDQNVVYVSPLAAGDGTRANPAGSLAEALAKSRKEGRTVLFLGAGTLGLDATADLGGLAVYGGWDPDLWEQTAAPGRTELTASSAFQGTSLIETGDRPWTLERTDLTASAGLKTVIRSGGGSAEVRNSRWTWSAAEAGWSKSGGRVELSSVAVAWSPGAGAPLLRFADLAWTGRDLSVGASGNQDGVVFRLDGVSAVLQNLTVVSKRAKGYDGVFRTRGGSLTADGLRIQAGDGADQAGVLVAEGTDAAFWNGEFNLFASKANTAFQVTGGAAELRKASVLILQGSDFNQAVVADSSEVSLGTVSLRIDSGAYQGGLSLDRSTLKADGLRVELAGGGQKAWGAQFLGRNSVAIDDAQWVLKKKTAGAVWLNEAPWSEGSTVARSSSQGW